MKEEKLNQVCGKILETIEQEIQRKGNENHKSYLSVYELVNSGDSEITEMFDDLTRSTAILKLATWRRNGLLSDSELNAFSEETRSSIERIASHMR